MIETVQSIWTVFNFGISATKFNLHLCMNQLAFTYNDRTLFHMLRHFEKIHEAANTCLLNRGYQQKKIDAAFQMPGSKFHPSFAQDLKMLEQHCYGGKIIGQDKIGAYLHIKLKFKTEKFPLGIGRLGVVPKKELSNLGTSDIYIKDNRGVPLQHASVNELPNSWVLSLVLKPQKNYLLLITAFPGNWALPIPSARMRQADLEASLQFWEEHIFLELV